jgi:S-adenosylmethionine synthetase
VCSGHPDKICDQVSDAILDAALAQDKKARVAVETMVTKNFIALAGEVTVDGTMPYTDIARSTVKKLGYTDPKLGFTHRSPIVVKIHTQSREISAGVDTDGAGDQGMMFGYACDETPDYMPLPITLSHALARRIDEVRKKASSPICGRTEKRRLRRNTKNGAPKAIKSIVLAVPHREDVTLKQVRDDLFEHAVKHVLAPFGLTYKLKDLVVNGTGIWHIGGPASDTGVTGRKIVVDTYGGMARVGGGAFFREGPDKSRPFGRLCRPVPGQKHRCRKTGKTVRGAPRLFHRRDKAGHAGGGNIRNGTRVRKSDPGLHGAASGHVRCRDP